MKMRQSTEDFDDVWLLLEQVKDPEIPVISVVDMGIVQEIRQEVNGLCVIITPTFVGCPAIDTIKEDIIKTLTSNGKGTISVEVTFKRPWSSKNITERGRSALKKFGLAPPPPEELIDDIMVLEYATCPRCNGQNTELRSPFGATLCRSIHYCNDCRESFEQFKPI